MFSCSRNACVRNLYVFLLFCSSTAELLKTYSELRIKFIDAVLKNQVLAAQQPVYGEKG